MTDDTGTAISERELDAALKVVELAHYLLEICMMEDQMKGNRVDAVEVKRPL